MEAKITAFEQHVIDNFAHCGDRITNDGRSVHVTLGWQREDAQVTDADGRDYNVAYERPTLIATIGRRVQYCSAGRYNYSALAGVGEPEELLLWREDHAARFQELTA